MMGPHAVVPPSGPSERGVLRLDHHLSFASSRALIRADSSGLQRISFGLSMQKMALEGRYPPTTQICEGTSEIQRLALAPTLFR